MIEFDKAFELVMGAARELDTERVGIDGALNRILAEDVTSDIDMPPFNKSAVDGFACRRCDLGNELTVVETICAGRLPTRRIGPGQCAKIMTGAPVPEGADCVVMVEYTKNTSADKIRFIGTETADNICPKAEDVKADDVLIRRGSIIGPQHIAVLAATGCVRPLVFRRPRVGIIATGNELVEPAVKPQGSQIRNSNSYQLLAQLQRAGAVPHYYGIAADSPIAIDSMLKKATADNDVVLLSGGVSMGDFDLVPGILRENGFKLLFEKVAIKPGKPTVFAVCKDKFCFGLPGNPVSTFVVFEVLVRPFLCRMMGGDSRPFTVPMRLEKTIRRHRTERMSWIPVKLTQHGGVVPVEYHGSAHINALCGADGITAIPIGVAEVKKGTTVNVRQI